MPITLMLALALAPIPHADIRQVENTPTRKAWVVDNHLLAPKPKPLAGPMDNPNEVPGCLPFCLKAPARGEGL